MNTDKLNIVVSFLLLLTFTVFSVGIPITKYVCLMMDEDNSFCDMMPQKSENQVSLTSQIPACCKSYIIAERNTVPFVKQETKNTLAIEKNFIPAINDIIVAATSYRLLPGQNNLFLMHQLGPPIQILNSTLLI